MPCSLSLLHCSQVPGGFPDSDHPSQTPSSPQEEERAGKQLEATRTAVPAHPEESNSAATQPKDLSNNLGDITAGHLCMGYAIT